MLCKAKADFFRGFLKINKRTDFSEVSQRFVDFSGGHAFLHEPQCVWGMDALEKSAAVEAENRENGVDEMRGIKVWGGRTLHGTVQVPGAKNSVLPIMAAAVLCEDRVTLERVPHLSDVECSARILQRLGCRVMAAEHLLVIEPTPSLQSGIPEELMRAMRSSIFFMAPLLARTGRADITMPGGCKLGARPIDIHLDGLAKMGVMIAQSGEQLHLTVPNGLKGADITLRFPSVGATETLLMAAVCAHGQTILRGCSMEPEVTDLARFLQKCGACIQGIGTRCLTVFGAERLSGCTYRICPDRITAATVMFAVAGCGGEAVLQDVCEENLQSVLRVLRRAGCDVFCGENEISIARYQTLYGVGSLITDVHPAFPTDAAPLAAAAFLRAQGTTTITDSIFENRFACAVGFEKMRGACGVQGRTICVQGVPRLAGSAVHAPDLRGGAALVLAAAQAEGESVITGVEHIARGYEDLAGLLIQLGAQAGYIQMQDSAAFLSMAAYA